MSGTLKLRPLDAQVAVQADDPKDKIGGIHIPDVYRGRRDRNYTGTVVAVGRGRLLRDKSRAPMELKAGDRVIFPKHAGLECLVEEGRELVLIDEAQVLAVIEAA